MLHATSLKLELQINAFLFINDFLYDSDYRPAQPSLLTARGLGLHFYKEYFQNLFNREYPIEYAIIDWVQEGEADRVLNDKEYQEFLIETQSAIENFCATGNIAFLEKFNLQQFADILSDETEP